VIVLFPVWWGGGLLLRSLAFLMYERHCSGALQSDESSFQVFFRGLAKLSEQHLYMLRILKLFHTWVYVTDTLLICTATK